MADNVTLPATGAGTSGVVVATREVTYSGDTAEVQAVGIVLLAGSDDAKTATDVAATSAAALPTTDVGTTTGASSQVTITDTSATIIASRAGRRSLVIVNNQTVAVYVDASGGTATTSHFRLDPGASLSLPLTGAVTGRTASAYTASGDAKVHVIEVY